MTNLSLYSSLPCSVRSVFCGSPCIESEYFVIPLANSDNVRSQSHLEHIAKLTQFGTDIKIIATTPKPKIFHSWLGISIGIRTSSEVIRIIKKKIMQALQSKRSKIFRIIVKIFWALPPQWVSIQRGGSMSAKIWVRIGIKVGSVIRAIMRLFDMYGATKMKIKNF